MTSPATTYPPPWMASTVTPSRATVKTHVLHVYAKLGVNDRGAAVAAGFERGPLPRG